ncbi:signal transduction protein : sensor, cNMP-binding domain-like protein [Ramlibacter tataouinensis TTB310]|uniref:Signal transduction protein: sensor, cNMP-binding domain-like protein n=2 Tax=Ramlibacter tataouinensis TaxID=94132 RepID=F5Y355_RAMTT|nr:signal transduction protein : sensor, cNMP-binding domain-like protein [Ramlibacter tataouinensis TTB310]
MRNGTRDAFTPALKPMQWEVLGSYLQPFGLTRAQKLIDQGSVDRTLYMVESGSLTVHLEDEKGRVRLAVVSAGSAVGEGAFFTGLPRNATVQAADACKIWSLTPLRFTELSNRNPAIALEIAMALGSLISRRLINKPKRVAVT